MDSLKDMLGKKVDIKGKGKGGGGPIPMSEPRRNSTTHYNNRPEWDLNGGGGSGVSGSVKSQEAAAYAAERAAAAQRADARMGNLLSNDLQPSRWDRIKSSLTRPVPVPVQTDGYAGNTMWEAPELPDAPTVAAAPSNIPPPPRYWPNPRKVRPEKPMPFKLRTQPPPIAARLRAELNPEPIENGYVTPPEIMNDVMDILPSMDDSNFTTPTGSAASTPRASVMHRV